MVGFLTYLVVILAVLTLAQVIRIFELTSELRGVKEEKVTLRDNRLNAKLLLWFMPAFFAFCAWQMYKYQDKLLPESASEHGVDLDWLFNFNMVIITIVFVITHILLFFFAFKYYFREGNKATFFAHSNKLELIWTTIPAIVLSVIIIYGLSSWNKITEPVDEKEAVVIELYAKQFAWAARYAGKDNVLGQSNYKLINDKNGLGLDMEDPNGQDDKIVRGEFHIPKGKTVLFKFRSQDVIHSGYFPHFRAQMNAVPGMTTSFHFVPTITTEEMRVKTGNPKFDYVVLCNKICGSAHWNMQIKLVVDEPAAYEKWVAEQRTFAEEMGPAEEASNENAQPTASAADSTSAAKQDSLATGK